MLDSSKTWLALGLLMSGLLVACDDDDDASPPEADVQLIDAADPTDTGPEPDVPLVDLGLVDQGLLEDSALPPDAARPACQDGQDNDGDGRVDYPDDRGCDDRMDDDESEAVPECADGLDNDEDGLIDVEDVDCIGPLDPTEQGGSTRAACSNGQDDDGDGITDFPFEPGCAAAGDEDEADPLAARACANGEDDDQDGLVDFPLDPGCSGRGDADEADLTTPPQCANGEDDDQDGLVDFPQDPGCLGRGDQQELNTCGEVQEVLDLNSELAANGYWEGSLAGGSEVLQGSCGGGAGPERVFAYRLDAPVQTLVFTTDHAQTEVPTVLYVRPICGALTDLACNRGVADQPGTTVALTDPAPGVYYVVVDTGSRTDGPGKVRLTVQDSAAPACRDARDNDGDGLVDLADPGCETGDDAVENDPDVIPQCADGRDNDGDGAVDWPADPECAAAGARREAGLCEIPFPSLTRLDQRGGTVEVVFPEEEESLSEGSCQVRSGSEFVVAVEVFEPSDISAELLLPNAGGLVPSVALYARSACEDEGTELACRQSPSRPMVLRGVEPGIYFLTVDGSGEQPTGLFLDVVVQSRRTACNDTQDNDADGLIDLADPGCITGDSLSEQDPAVAPACADGQDNDGDGLTDWPLDDGCTGSGDGDEDFACRDYPNLIELGQQGGEVNVDVAGLASHYQGRCGGTGGEAVIQLDLDVPSAVEIATYDADFDTLLYVRSACDVSTAELGCNDDISWDEETSALSFARLEAGRYYVFVDSTGNNGDQASLGVAVEPVALNACEDGVDNDRDGRIDAADLGCRNHLDNDEANLAAPPACADGVDNDGDGLTDWPLDVECPAAGGASEELRCLGADVIEVGQAGGLFNVPLQAGLDRYTGSCDEGEGEAVFAITLDEMSDIDVAVKEDGYSVSSVLYLRSRCDEPGTELGCVSTWSGTASISKAAAGTYYLFVERGYDEGAVDVQISVTSRVTQCNDAVDNDGDGLIDLFDPGCVNGDSPSEQNPAQTPQCADGLDNDGDGFIDYPADDACTSAGGASERLVCGASANIPRVGLEGATVAINTAGRTNEFTASCGSNANSPDQPVAVVLPVAAAVTAEITGATHDTVLHLRSSCAVGDYQIACDDDSGEGSLSKLSFDRLEAGIYYFIVDGYGAANSGASNLVVTVTPLEPLPERVACQNGQDDDEDGLIDRLDPGCESYSDADETDPAVLPECGDGLDNDSDGVADTADPACTFAGQPRESQACAELTALDVTATGRFATDELASFSDQLSGGSCEVAGGRDVLLRYIASPAQAGGRLVARLGSRTSLTPSPSIAVRRFCDFATSELSCGATEARVNGAGAGEYYVLVQGAGEPSLRSLGQTIALDEPTPEGLPYVPAQAMSSAFEDGTNAWLPAGAAGDRLGHLTLAYNNETRAASIAVGNRTVRVGGASVTIRSAFKAPGVLRVSLEGQAGVAVDAMARLFSAGEALTELTTLQIGARTLQVGALVRPNAPMSLVVVADARSTALRVAEDGPQGLQVRAAGLGVPSALYFVSTYGDLEDALGAIAQDLAYGELEVEISVER